MNASLISPDAQAIISALRERTGTNLPIQWERECETYKEVIQHVTKRTSAHVRCGIDYANLASVQAGIASGERGEVQPLPVWQEWAHAPFILRHKGNGTEYIRLFPSSFANLKPTVEYFIDGTPATLADVTPLLKASELRERDEAPACFNVKVSSILAIG